MTSTTSPTVASRDGTRIAFDRSGDGPPVILVDAALHYRSYSSFHGLVPLLAREFTVYTYDRRGRGESMDTAPYTPDREVEDLDALITEAGGSAYVFGYSSGALLAMRAAAHGLQISGLALFEPPLQDENEDAEAQESDFTAELAEVLRGEGKAAAVEYFLVGIGVPPDFVASMRSAPDWPNMEAVAHTLLYDCAISDATTSTTLRSVAVPTLVLDSLASTDDLTGWAAAVAAQLPRASHRSLAGEWHVVPDDTLAPVLAAFFHGVS
jgi:pimeloyl-ACP methyl ester carboxylesterase